MTRFERDRGDLWRKAIQYAFHGLTQIFQQCQRSATCWAWERRFLGCLSESGPAVAGDDLNTRMFLKPLFRAVPSRPGKMSMTQCRPRSMRMVPQFWPL